MSQFPEEVPTAYETAAFTQGYIKASQDAAYTFEVIEVPIQAGVANNSWWIRNDSAELDLVFFAFMTGWDGGSTTFIKPLTGRFFGGVPEPTGNSQPMVVLPNSNSTPALEATAYQWNGAGAGLTVAAPGFQSAAQVFGTGMTVLAPQAAFIVRTGEGLMGQYESSEAGVLTVSIAAFTTKTGTL